MRIKVSTGKWTKRKIKAKTMPKTEITKIETHKSHLPSDWRNRILKEGL
jgi:hypothetical protein